MDFYYNENAQTFLEKLSSEWKMNLNTEDFARNMDNHDPLRNIRQEFSYPKTKALPYGLYR